ncbi:ABC1 kinase family protein [Leeia aquatica]|uniref:AarF/ABC1/UbiB kinase family protein n=1 Tax=Leeia aquatica TaxID=2725557 RepID=A0A847SAB5_9NEIS|nr:AarF/ABC1/UbiB kinase family protein [Leeia aquatica]NLR74028.1 AarF/ABC1/UbiB kinase family protein [Leeia aquatica]
MSKLPEGKWARLRLSGSVLARVGAGRLQHRIKRPFMQAGARIQAQQQLEEREAAQLFEVLAQLRGTALKVAQWLSSEQALLPEAWQRHLRQACHQAPPLNRVLIRKVLQEGLGQAPEQCFSHFEADAFAAASLGQVHAATLPDGRAVAVKLQYPGIRYTIDSDMALLRLALRGMPRAAQLLDMLPALHQSLLDEVDYVREARLTDWFYQRLQVDGVQVPQWIASHSSTTVLTTTRMQGMHLDDWLATVPDQAHRDRAAQRLLDAVMSAALQGGQLYTDPHPGNFLFQPDGQVVLLDFGAVRPLSAEFVQHWPQLMHAHLQQSPAQLLAAWQAMGMRYDGDLEADYPHMAAFCQWIAEPWRDSHFDFTHQPAHSEAGLVLMQRMSHFNGLKQVAPDLMFFDRTLYGLFKLFERMGARVALRHWLPAMASETPDDSLTHQGA